MNVNMLHEQNIECGWKECYLRFIDIAEMNIHVRLKHLNPDHYLPCQCRPIDNRKNGSSCSSNSSTDASILSEPTAYLKEKEEAFDEDFPEYKYYNDGTNVFPDFSINTKYPDTTTDFFKMDYIPACGTSKSSAKSRDENSRRTGGVKYNDKRFSSNCEPEMTRRISKTGYWNKLNDVYYCTYPNCGETSDSCVKINKHFRKMHTIFMPYSYTPQLSRGPSPSSVQITDPAQKIDYQSSNAPASSELATASK